MAQFLLDSPLLKQSHDDLELCEAERGVGLCQPLQGDLGVSATFLLHTGIACTFDGGRKIHGGVLARVSVEGSLHAKPVLDAEICVDLSDVLDEKSGI